MIPLIKELSEADLPMMVIYILLFLLAVLFLWKTILQDYFSPLWNIPEPKRHWLLRHLPYFYNNKDLLRTIEGFCEQFKDKGMFKLDTMTGDSGLLVFLLKSEYVKTVLSKPNIFPRNSYILRTFLPLTGNALLTANGDEHRYQKKFFTKSFSYTQMKYFVPVFSKHAKILTEIWSDLTKNKENGVNLILRKYFNKMTLDAVGEISFGFSFNSQKTKLTKFAEAMVMILEGVIGFESRFIFNYFPFMWYMPFGPANALKKAIKMANIVLDEVIQTRLKLMKEGKLTETQKNDLLATMLNDRDEHFNDQLVKDSAFTFLLAGHETTATSLPGILMYLAKYPEWQEKVRNEINSTIDDAENIEIDDMSNMPYTDAFIKESMRLYVAVPVTQRYATVDYKFGDYIIPKNTLVNLPLMFLQKNEFEKSNDFFPERWIDGEVKNGTIFSFGYGPMGCIGKHFALLEIKTTLIHLLKSFRFTIDPGCDEYKKRVALTLKITPDLKIRVHQL